MSPTLNAPLKMTLEINNTCNMNCAWCYKECTREPDPRELTTQQWKDVTDRLEEHGIINLYIEGGEPFHREDILELLEYMARKMVVWVRTNATLIDLELARELRRIGVGWVLSDVLGATKETHERMTGVPGSFEASCRGVENLSAAGVRNTLLMVLTRQSAPELQDYLYLARDLGAQKVGVLRLYPLGRAKARWNELCLSVAECMKAFEGLEVPEGLTYSPITQSWHPNDANCCYQMACINWFGRSIGCAYLREYVDYGNVLESSLDEIWNHPQWKRIREGKVRAGACGGCGDATLSRGGCRSTAYAFTGDWEGLDPFCVNHITEVDVRELPEWLLQKSGKPQDPASG
jgi:radical SAM protein with 4Fe4S-binding SPASM domain